MSIELVILILIGLNLLTTVLVFSKKEKKSDIDINDIVDPIKKQFDEKIDKTLREEFRSNREESNKRATDLRGELTKSFGDFKQGFDNNINKLNEILESNFKVFENRQKRLNDDAEKRIAAVKDNIGRDLKSNREESNKRATNLRGELTKSFSEFKQGFDNNITKLNEMLVGNFKGFETKQKDLNDEAEKRITTVKDAISSELKNIRQDNTNQLNEMRKTVDEKLQKTLNDRLSQSFKAVSSQLESVQKGLGEMKSLQSDVGSLKSTLTHVKKRGVFGETQLEMLLEEMLAPQQWSKNVTTKEGSSKKVDFVVNLPGKDNNKPVMLPIDAKFPLDYYEKLNNAYDEGEREAIEKAQKEFRSGIAKMAESISNKYLNPPYTTDFGLMYVPTEGIFAEATRSAQLVEDLRRKYQITIVGPTTLSAILNSLQMGFKTLAIEKRTNQVWDVLTQVQTEFRKFEDLMDKAKKNIQQGLNKLDDLSGVRTRQINRQLDKFTNLDPSDNPNETPQLMPTEEKDEEFPF
ncbi:MAG: DNA recombination protein RmuC [Flavobacteriaceae bacterium]|nr:DNA recombination protein RmuC [Flavobacteriaceae bacterium]